MTTNNDEGSTDVVLEPAPTRITFARKNDLQKVMRKLDKSVDKAIEFLEEVMLNPENDSKLRVECAKTILDKKVQISEAISRDQLSRTVGEAKMLMAERATQQKRIKDVEHEDDEPVVPKYCPDMIVDHSTISKM